MGNRILIMAFAAALLPAIAWCQPEEADGGEFAGYGGGLFGVGSHGYVGASTGLAAGRYAFFAGDVSYAPLGKNTIRNRNANESVEQSRLYDFNVSLHVRFPIGRRFAPYVIAGPGVVWDNFRMTKLNSSGVAVVTANTEANFAFHTGAGLRYYLKENWGIRPEVRVVITNKTYTAVSCGVFYTFPTGMD